MIYISKKNDIYVYIYFDVFCFCFTWYCEGTYDKTKVITLQSQGSVPNFKHTNNMTDSSRLTWRFKIVLQSLVIAGALFFC